MKQLEPLRRRVPAMRHHGDAADARIMGLGDLRHGAGSLADGKDHARGFGRQMGRKHLFRQARADPGVEHLAQMVAHRRLSRGKAALAQAHDAGVEGPGA